MDSRKLIFWLAIVAAHAWMLWTWPLWWLLINLISALWLAWELWHTAADSVDTRVETRRAVTADSYRPSLTPRLGRLRFGQTERAASTFPPSSSRDPSEDENQQKP